MFSIQKRPLYILLLVILGVLLTMPAVALAADNSQVVRFPFEDTIRVQRENGAVLTVDSLKSIKELKSEFFKPNRS